MKFSLSCKMMILAVAVALTTPAFAGGSGHSGYVTFGNSVQINGQQIPAGDYKVTWDGDGPNVNLHVLRGSKEVATAPATVKQLDAKAPQDASETKAGGAGSPEVTAIRFSGKKYELNLNSASSQAEVK